MADDSPSRGDKLLILTALIFAVRIFRDDEDKGPPVNLSDDLRSKWLASDANDRAFLAQRAALDADAILKAVEKIP
jgi:hypothetical protein